MRFLCFHGQGGNTQVMEAQIAALCHELEDGHTFEFVEATFPAPLAPALRPFYPEDQAYFEWMPQDDPSLVLQALRDLDKFIEVEGPFDGIIAFSMGALLTTTYLIQHGIKKPHTPLPFQCGIFLSGQVPVDPIALERGEIRVLDPAVDGDQLMANFPTAHIWDPNDEAYRDQSERLSGLCDPRVQLRLHHGEGHAVPGPRAQDSLLGSVRVIRRTVEQAAMMV